MEQDQPDSLTARVPFTTVLASVVGLWLCYFLLTTLRSELLDLGFASEMLWRRALATVLGIAITLGLWLVLRLFDARPLWTKIVAALVLSMPVAVAIAQSNQWVFADLERKVMVRVAEQQGLKVREAGGGELLVDIPGMDITTPETEERRGPQTGALSFSPQAVQSNASFTEVFFGRYFMMLAWCALYLALLTGEKARAAERREGDYRRAAKAAELRSLRYQVNPHFLFNTLNSLSALVLTGRTQQAEKMIQTISTFYRRSLADDPTSEVPLREEFALQKMYLDIEAVRFPQRLRTVYDLPPELEDAKVPGMILQPLVENSVKHAVAPTSRQVTITMSAREEYGRLVVTVADDGPVDSEHGQPRHGYGIGLANVRERLEARFGNEASVVTGRVPAELGGGYATQLRLPILRQGKEA
ncbi:MAG: histidine kinase [Croceibacterium sp.]